MEVLINNSLKLENISTAKEIHDKIIILAPKVNFRQSKEETARHRKNNSMNFFDPSPLQE
jgi:hypothetical protein